MERRYNAIVIGSGFGGLGAAAMLADQDHSVLVLERHGLYGGFAQYFKRKRFFFDISLHGFPRNFVDVVQDLFGSEAALDMHRVQKIVTRTPDYRIETTFDFEDFSNILVNRFQQSPENVQRFFGRLEQVNIYDPPGVSTGEFLNEFFPGRPDIHRFLLEIINIANGCTFQDPMKIFCIVLRNFLAHGPFFCKAGSDVLVNRMVSSLQQRGVQLEKWKTASRIVLKGGRVSGVEVTDRKGHVEFIACDAVVSNANLIGTCRDLVGHSAFSKEFSERLRAVRLSLSACQVFLGLREPLDFRGDILFINKDPFNPNDIIRERPGCISYTMYYPHVRANRFNSMTIGSTQLASWDNWKDLSDEAYAEKKQDLIESTLDHLQLEIPDIRDRIEFVNAATPRTMQRYTAQENGAIYGTKFEGIELADRIPEEIPGLYYSGSVGLLMSGWLGTLLRGLTVSDEVDTYIMHRNSKGAAAV